MELRNVEEELEQLKKRINNKHLSKADLLVLNLLPMTTSEKVELFQEVFAEHQRKVASEATVLHVADPLPPLPPKLKRETTEVSEASD